MSAQYSNSTKLAESSQAVRGGIATDTQFGAIVPPLVLSTNFSFAEFGQKRKYDYTRSGNPTRDVLADTLAKLEHGFGAVITSTGMSAVTLIAQLLGPQDTIIISHDCYGGTYRLFKILNERKVCKVIFADLKDESVLASISAIAPRIVWIETPSNPLLRVYDIARIADIAHTSGALCVVDNTFLSPGLQQPLLLGADLVIHSTTKYLNGHSDVVGGAVVSKTQELQDELTWWANCLGLTGSPFDSYLTLRGVRTLFPRLKAHNTNATAIANILAHHPAVSAVYYPGLPNHPDHKLASTQQSGFGGMLSFELYGGQDAIKAFLEGLELFSLAESLGGVESLVAHPATMTHASMDAEGRQRAAISDGLLRLSVGIEDEQDLVNDIYSGLQRALGIAENTNSQLLGSEVTHTPASIRISNSSHHPCVELNAL
jgi:cystathionine gamma-synthase